MTGGAGSHSRFRLSPRMICPEESPDEGGQINQVRFTPVKIDAVQLSISSSDAPCAIQ